MAKEEQFRKTLKQNTTRLKNEAKPRMKTGTKTTKAAARKSLQVDATELADATSAQVSSADGERLLLDSVNQVVAAYSTKIAEKLGEEAVAGNVSSAKLLVDLITKKKVPAKLRAEILSACMSRLEDEPECGEHQEAGIEN